MLLRGRVSSGMPSAIVKNVSTAVITLGVTGKAPQTLLYRLLALICCSMPQASHEAHRRRVRVANIAPASLTLNPF